MQSSVGRSIGLTDQAWLRRFYLFVLFCSHPSGDEHNPESLQLIDCNGRPCLTALLYTIIKITINPMLTFIAVVLIALWLLGVVTSHTIGGFIHVLLIVAIIMILVRLIRGQQVL